MSAAVTYEANPRGIPTPLLGMCGLLVVIGVAAFIAGLMTDAATAWRAFHVNFIYFACLAQGGIVLGSALVIVGARWAGPIRHVAEGLSAWVPVSFVLFAIGGFFGREAIFEPWLHGAPYGKEAWLSFGRVYVMNLAILGALTLLTLAYLKASFRPAMEGAADRATQAKGMFQSWTKDWKGADAEYEASQKRLKVLAPIVCLSYAFGFTFIGYDQVMSLSPTWFSNIFGWYFAWPGFLNAIAATTVICVLLRGTPGWMDEVTRPRLHDLGKMIFAFSIFWMYLFFAQYIVIWYGNMPEETQFIEARLGSQFLQETWTFAASRLGEPYVAVALTAWVGCWVIPFWVLLGQAPKRSWYIVGPVATISLLGFWLERNVLIWPSFVPDDGFSWLGPIQLGIAAGFFGAFTLVYLVFSRVFPTLPLPRRS